jgi:hypothetical protein
MTTVLAESMRLTDDQLRVAASRAGVDDLPTVLAAPPRHATVDRRDAAFAQATGELVSRHLIVDGAVHPEFVSVLQTLQRPDRELAMRLVTPEGTARISVARRGRCCVLARRVNHDITLRTVGPSSGLRQATSALLAELPVTRTADIQPVGAPLRDMAESLSGTHDPVDLADRIRALGAEPHAAMLLGTALASRRAFAEIVYYALTDDEDRISRRPAAVAVFYTKRGRLVAAPSVSAAGQLWTTCKPGSDHAVMQAIGRLVELSDDGWGDP